MGCDIHAYLEVKNNNGDWLFINEPEKINQRNYRLFATLAGVRNSFGIDPISNPRGIPEDVTDYVKGEFDTWEGDGHNHSYLTAKELLEFDYDKRFELEDGKYSYRDLIDSYSDYFKFLKDLKYFDKPEDVRLVFWFDN